MSTRFLSPCPPTRLRSWTAAVLTDGFCVYCGPSRIGQNQSTIVCPVIDTIDWNTFEFYMQTDEPMIGGFDWRLTFQWHAVPEAERRRRTSHTDPIR